MDRNVEMFMSVAKHLLQNKCYSLPQVYIQEDVEPKDATKLKEIIKRHQVSFNPDLLRVGVWKRVKREGIKRGKEEGGEDRLGQDRTWSTM